MHACMYTHINTHVHVCIHAYSVSRSLTHAICRLRARLFPNISTKDLCGRARECTQQEREIARQRDFDTFAFARSALASSCRAAK